MDKKDLDNYLKRTDLVLENNLCRWDSAYNGDINGLYTGTFVFKCFLTPSEKLAAGRDYRELLGSNAVLALKYEDNLAFVLSQLKYRIVSAPPFWTSSTGLNGFQGDLSDEKVLDVIFEAALSAEFKYLAMLQEKKEKAIKKAKDVAENVAENKLEEESEKEQEIE